MATQSAKMTVPRPFLRELLSPSLAGLGEQAATGKCFAPREAPASLFAPPRLSIPAANCHIMCPLRTLVSLQYRGMASRAQTAPSQLSLYKCLKSTGTLETILITVICPCCGCLGMQLSHRSNMLLVTPSSWSDHQHGVWELQMQVFFHLYFLSRNKFGSSEASACPHLHLL